VVAELVVVGDDVGLVVGDDVGLVVAELVVVGDDVGLVVAELVTEVDGVDLTVVDGDEVIVDVPDVGCELVALVLVVPTQHVAQSIPRSTTEQVGDSHNRSAFPTLKWYPAPHSVLVTGF